MFGLFRRKRWAHRGDTSVAPDEKGKRDWQDYFNDDKSPTWTHHFGEPVGKNHPIWKTYVRVALAHDHEYVEAMARDMENLLVFSTLFSAVVTTCLLQFEQQLQTLSSEDDPAIYTAYAVRYLINNQINLFLQSLGIKTSSFPTLEETSPDPYFPTIAISLWYFSLDCALLVAGGAVCVKQWLLQYEKANKLHHSAYERAIHHQQRSRNMQKWHVQEFGDFLGSLMLLDLIPFFAGSLYHYDVSNTGAAAFNGIASGFLCVYTAFIAFTIIVGVLMPTSPFRTPISNLIESIPRNLADDFRNGTVTKAILALPFVISIAIISFLWTKTSVYIFWTILLCLAPMILCIFLGLRNGLKMGRVSHFVPIMSIGITILATLSLGFVDLHPYVFGDVLRVGFPFIYTAISFLVISGLSQRFSNPGSERRLPVNAVLLGSAGLVAGLYIAWLYTFVAFEFTDPVSDQVFITYWATPVASSIVLASTAILCVAFLVPEDEVEEDIREAEALGWLMNQTSDSQILHDALLCLLGLASTPLRRRELLDKTRSILASLINSMIDPPEQLCLLADGREDMVGSGRAYEAGHDSRLTFYVACLAELSQAVIQTRRHDHRREMRWNRWVTRLRGSWIPINWYRILTFVPHHTLEREHRFPRSWYSWFHSKKPETLLSDLRVLTSRQDRYLSAMARAALSQLYPSYSPLHDRRLWPVRYSDQSEDNSFFTLHRVLIEFRMVTIWAIGECCWKKSLGISLRRYLYRYCDDMMKFWMERVAWLEAPRKPSGGDNENVDEEVEEAVEQVPEDRARLIRQYGTAFRAVTELGYVIIENHHDLLRTTQSGESTPMKAARCLMALSRWFDGLQPDLDLELDLELDLDGEVYRSFAHSMISATRTYLLLAVKHYKPSRQHHSKEQIMEHDENTIFVGMKHLETPLIHLACRSWNDDRLAKLAISTLEDFYSIPGHAENKLLQWNIPYLTRVVDHWKSRLTASDTTPAEQVSAIRAFARILNLDSQPANAQSIPLNLKSLLEVIDSGARPVSAGFHDALLSAVLETPVLQPLPTQSRYVDQTNPKTSDPASARDYVALDLPHTAYYLELLPLYKNILDGYSPLVEAVNEPTSPIAKERIQRSLQLIDMLTKSMNLEHLPEVLYETAVYPSLLVSIAWREEGNMDESSKSISSCELAIELFARLWAISNKMDEQKGTHAEETFTTDAHLEKIANAVNWLTDCRVSMELDCISLWVNRLGSVSCSPEMPGYVRLVKALEGAVAYGAFDDPDPGVEEQRKNVFRQLSILIKSTVSQEPSSVDKEASSGIPT